MATGKWWRRAGAALAVGQMLLLTTPLLAADRALIVGVGEYQDSSIRGLAGIDLDVNIMKDVAELLGFGDDEIRVLSDSQATSENIEEGIRSWLGSAGPNDKVLLYYSGHGAFIPDESGDESDGNDEVILGYSTRVVKHNGRTTLEGVVIDDNIEELLNNLRSKNVLVMFDSCHSGTASKGLALNLQTRDMRLERLETKSFQYKGMPQRGRGIAVSENIKGSENYVYISACRDDQQSAASSNGSLFTLGMSKAIKKAAGKGESISPSQLQQAASDYIAEQARSNSDIWKFDPQISGNSSLMNTSLFMVDVSNANGPGWKKLEKLYQRVADKSLHLEIEDRYRIGDAFDVSMSIDRPGYLLLLYVDAADEITILYPNKFHTDGRVDAGRITIGGPEGDFDMTISEPSGKHQVVAFWARNPFKSYSSGYKAVEDYVAVMSEKSMSDLGRGIELSGKSDSRSKAWIRAGRAEFSAR